MELAKKFREEIHSVAIHPDGLYVAAGFIDKIRFLNLLIDDMRLFQVRSLLSVINYHCIVCSLGVPSQRESSVSV